jgi:Arc/MetJ-type ribon-helix-helix transcriptional regulator
MRMISVKMPESLVDGIDELVERGVYRNRSAVVRAAVRDLLLKELISSQKV